MMNIAWKRCLKISSLFLCFLIMITAIFFMGTTLGLKVLVRQAQSALLENGIQVNTDQIHGRLGSFTIDELVYHEEIYIRLNNVHLRWEPLSVLFRKISIQDLTADTFELALGDKNKTNAREELKAIHAQLHFKMPTIRLHQASFKKFILKDKNFTEILQAETISGDATITNQNIYFNHLQATWMDFNTKLFGDISLEDTHAIDLKGQLSRIHSIGKLDVNMVLLITSHTFKIKGDGHLTLGSEIIPLSYELSEQPNHFELWVKDTEIPSEHQLHAKAKFQKNASSWQTELSAKMLDVNYLLPALHEPIDLMLRASGDHAGYSLQSEIRTSLHNNTLQGGIHCNKIQPTTPQCALETLSLQYENKHWALAQETPFILTPSQFEIPHLCLQNEYSHLCGQGYYNTQEGDYSLVLDSQDFDNQLLDPFLHPATSTGVSQFHLDLKRDSSGIEAHININADQTMLTLDRQSVQFTKLQLEGTHARNTSHASLHFLTEKNDTGEVTLELAKQDEQDPELSGIVDLHLRELNPINLYLSNLYEIDGAIEAKITLGGTLKEPLYDGSFLIEGSQARIPQLGLQLNQIALDVSGKRNSQIHIKGSAQTESDGVLALQGAITLTQNEISSEFTLQGEGLQLINLPTARAKGSLDLAFKQTGADANLTGNIRLHEGKFDGRMLQRRFGSDTDIIFVNHRREPLIQNSPSLNTAYNIHLSIEDKVYFSGFDVNTQIKGEAAIQSSAQSVPKANGQFDLVNGSYDAYGKHFVIEEGGLIYNQSALDNPNLNIVAQYDLLNTNFNEDGFNKLSITIRALGSLRQPRLVLSSRPKLSQEDILSYLVLGAPISQVGDNSAPLSQAALAFTLKGGSQNVLNNIRKTLGLSQLSLGSIAPGPVNSKNASPATSEDRGFQDNTAVFIGRAVSPNLYVSYGIGLFNAQQVVRTRLKLGRRWQLITESSNAGNGVDFIYVIERGD